MPLSMSDLNKDYVITRIGGKPEVRKHLANLGFVVGSPVSVVALNHGNAIINIKGSRIAISEEMCRKIYV